MLCMTCAAKRLFPLELVQDGSQWFLLCAPDQPRQAPRNSEQPQGAGVKGGLGCYCVLPTVILDKFKGLMFFWFLKCPTSSGQQVQWIDHLMVEDRWHQAIAGISGYLRYYFDLSYAAIWR